MGTVVDAYLERKTVEVLAETWGHLAPEVGRSYPGTILFAQDIFDRQVCAIEVEFAGLDDSPWFFGHLQDWFCRQQKLPLGQVYRFTGTYCCRNNGTARFSGKVVKLELRSPEQPRRKG